jgi:hypothetical protein
VGVWVGVSVEVGVGVKVGLGVSVGVGAGDLVGAGVAVGLSVGVRVGVADAATVGLAAGNIATDVAVEAGVHAANNRRLKHTVTLLLGSRSFISLLLFGVECTLLWSTPSVRSRLVHPAVSKVPVEVKELVPPPLAT